jgi:hypothetical protein
MLGQHLAAVRIDLAKRHCFKSARALKTEREAADTTEQVKVLEHLTPLPSF